MREGRVKGETGEQECTDALALYADAVGINLLLDDPALAALAVDPLGPTEDALNNIVPLPAGLAPPPAAFEFALPGFFVLDDEVDLSRNKGEGG